MNQIFSPQRFLRYANYNLRSNKKFILLLIGGFSVALFFFELFLLSVNNPWRSSNWSLLFFMTFAFSGLLVVGHSFHFLRKQKTSFSVFLLPVSTFEKYIYELFTKVVLFTVLFFVLFPVISFLVINTIEIFSSHSAIVPFRYSSLDLPKETFFLKLIFWGFLFAFSLAFAGAATIKRFPLIKTLLFVGAVAGAVISYFYFILENLHLNYGIAYIAEKIIGDQDNALTWLFTILGISALTAFTYAFFKLKEREV